MTDITPTIAQISALERTRTVNEAGTELGLFGNDTRPTDTEALAVAAIAVGLLSDQPEYLQNQYVATLLTCLLIEQSYFRDADQVLMFRDLLMREGYVIDTTPGGGAIEARRIGTVMMRPGMTEYDPYYPKPFPIPDWPYPGANT